jgi:2-polyprenyl-6-methoxyphenol hydroxylase-like FAD-dependent oxidoreductase
VGVVGRIEGCQASDELGRVRVESAEDGWWYGVQFSDGCLLAAWMTDAINLRGRPGGAHGLWREQLRSATLLAPIAESGRWPDRVAVFDAATQILDARPIPGFLAVGDAAAAYDPLSSWGITKGVRDGCAGAEALRRERSGDRDAVAQHRAVQRRDFDAHRTQQRGFYRAETRWATSPFWRIRQRAATSTLL